MALVGFGDILFQIGGDDMGDLEFIEQKVIAGDYFQVSGDINALNDTIEYIVPNGKRAFMIDAKITMNTNQSITTTSSSGNLKNHIVADLKIDSVSKSKAKLGQDSSYTINTGGGGGGGIGVGVTGWCPFNVLGLSLVGDDAKKIEIVNVLDNGSAFAEMSGYLV